MRNQKLNSVSDTYGGALGHMGEKRERRGRRGKKRARGDRREEKTRLMGSAFRPHGSEGLRKVQNKNWAKAEMMRGRIKSSSRPTAVHFHSWWRRRGAVSCTAG